jgi:glycosyltransferase involved in cell wall biosynthesis
LSDTLNILFYSPSNNIGGAEISLLESAKYLTSNGHNVYIALPKADDKSYEDLLQPYVKRLFYVKATPWMYDNRVSKWSTKFITYCYSAYKSGWHVKPVWSIYKFLKKFNINIVHSNSLSSFDAAIAAKLAGVPHVQHIREISGYQDEAIRSFFYQHTKAFKMVMNRLNDAVVCNSYYTLVKSKQYFPVNKARVIYNPVSTDIKINKPEKKNKFVVGCVANITATMKNHSFVIDVASVVCKHNDKDDMVFKFYGKLPDVNHPYYVALTNMIQSEKLQHKVVFEGSRPIGEIYSEIDLLLHPYPYEAFGRVYIEAMAARVPVLAIEGGGASELIKNNETGFLFRKDAISECAEIICDLKHNTQLYSRIADAAYEYAQKFDSGKVLLPLLELYRGLSNKYYS